MRLGPVEISAFLRRNLDYAIPAGIVLVSVLIYLISPAWLNHADIMYLQEDKMFSQRRVDPGSDVTIVAIDDSSIINLGRWPWNRETVAQLVWSISLAGPKVIGLDLDFPKDVTQDTSGQTQVLAQIIEDVGNVVLPIHFSFSRVGVELPQMPSFIPKSALDPGTITGVKLELPAEVGRVDYPDPKIAEGSYRLGHVNLFFGGGNKVRDEKLLLRYQNRIYPSFAFQLAQKYLGTQVSTKDGEELYLKDFQIPMDKKGDFRINYSGPNGTFRYLPAWKVLNGKVDAMDLHDKIVLVGLANSVTSNRVLTPASDEKMYEVERVANVTENLVHGNSLAKLRLSGIWNVLIIFFLGLFCIASFHRITWVYRFALVFMLMLMVVYFNYVILPSLGLLGHPSYHILELILFGIFAPFIDYIRPPRKEDRTEEMTEEYISESELEAAPVRVIRDDEFTSKVETKFPQAGVTPFKESKSSPLSTPSSSELALGKITKSTTSSLHKSTSHLGIKQFGRYRILGLLGKGAMGTVYKGEDPAIGRLVALKTIRMDFSENQDEVNELRERLMREAQAAGSMSHPNIVTIYDVGQEGDSQYIAMECLEGYTLESYLRKKGELNYKILAKIMMQACEALSFAHSKGIVHRDIKPANIMILDNFEVKVMDFGIARFGAPSMTQVGTAIGTPNYISPEQLEGKPADKRSDIFSLGVVLYEFLTGQRPFKGETISALAYSIINDNPPAPSSVNDKTPPIFDRIVAKALAKDPNERYQNAEEITKTLREFIASFVVSRSVKL